MHPLVSHLQKVIFVGLGVPIAVIAVPLFLLYLGSLIFGGPVDFWGDREVVSQIISPANNIAAVLVETNGGATTSFGYEIYLVPVGEKIDGKPRVAYIYGATRNHNAYGVNLKWESPNKLAVEYYQEKSRKVSEEFIAIANTRIQVVLREGVLDPSAPSGGMGFNLRRG